MGLRHTNLDLQRSPACPAMMQMLKIKKCQANSEKYARNTELRDILYSAVDDDAASLMLDFARHCPLGKKIVKKLRISCSQVKSELQHLVDRTVTIL